MSLRRILHAVILSVVLACALDAEPQNAPLPDDAQQVLRQTVTQLQLLAERYMASGQQANARAILDQIQRIQSGLSAGLTPRAGFVGLGMMGYRNRTGETFRVRVTGASSGGTVWGTDIYTDDSDLAVAVVHAGLLSNGQDGEVLITFAPGQSQYQGSTRNSVTTRPFGDFLGSFRLARVDAASASVPVLPPPTAPPNIVSFSAPSAYAQYVTGFAAGQLVQVGPQGFPFDDQTMWQLLGGQASGNRANAGPNLMGLRNRVGETFEYDVTGGTQGTIWGDGIYTDDSELSVVVVHAGLLRVGERGRVRVTVLPAQQQYQAASRNGVNSQSYRGWEGSYRVERADSR